MDISILSTALSHLRRCVIWSLITVFTFAGPAQAAGFGWYYESFSWQGLQTYFGGGNAEEKAGFHAHMKEIVAQEDRDPYFGIRINDGNLSLWRKFIDSGLDYHKLDRAGTQFADQVIALILHVDSEVALLDVQPESSPDYVHPESFRGILPLANAEERRYFEWFSNGRSLGQADARPVCIGQGRPWRCYGAYVILSPQESEQVAKAIDRTLSAPNFVDDGYERKIHLAAFSKALARAAKQGRGIYVHTAD